MSTMPESAPTSKNRRVRRQFTDEFCADAVLLVSDEHRSIAQDSRELDRTESALRLWVDRARANRSKGRSGVLKTAAREELARLRKEDRVSAPPYTMRATVMVAHESFRDRLRLSSPLPPRRQRHEAGTKQR